MIANPDTAPNVWDDALLATRMIALDRHGWKGVHVRARAGVVRDRWLADLLDSVGTGVPVMRIASGISVSRLTGGLDLGATLAAGRPVIESGVLAAVDGGILVLAMAERMDPSGAAVIAAALDSGVVVVERDGLSVRQSARFVLIALDEGVEEDEGLAPALADRMDLRIDLNSVGWRETEPPTGGRSVAATPVAPASVSIADTVTEALCAVAASVGVQSMRAPLQLVRAARSAAALRGSSTVEIEDATTALRLVLGIRISGDPPPQDDEQPQDAQPEPPAEQPQDDDQKTADPSIEELEDMLVAAVEASLPKHLLAGLESGPSRRSKGVAGKAGALRNSARRGRAVGVSDKPPVNGARPDVLATLRQAAPWQRIRSQNGSPGALSRLKIRKQDFRYVRHREKNGTTAIFAVDASGSSAVERLAETKGAVELLLAECYVRRDSVALVAFRGAAAETLLEPTRSLTRAKRCLSALPGGGGTPLAAGIVASLAMANASVRKGQSVVAVFLTDGRGNVALDGSIGRDRVDEDTGRAARLFRGAGIRSILIDTARRPQARAQALARDLGAEYLPLPRGGSRAMAREISDRMEG